MHRSLDFFGLLCYCDKVHDAWSDICDGAGGTYQFPCFFMSYPFDDPCSYAYPLPQAGTTGGKVWLR